MIQRVMAVLAAFAVVLAPAPARAEDLFEYYAFTGQYVRGEYLRYYRSKGGPAVLGYPRTNDFRERDRLVQYFENIRLEWDCGSDGRQPCVLRPGNLGEQILGQSITLSEDQRSTGTLIDGVLVFSEVNAQVAEPFLTPYRELGGFDFFGYPLGNARVEAGQTVQWFQRARLQLDPDGIVRLSPLGNTWIDVLRRVSVTNLVRQPAPAPLGAINVLARPPAGRIVYQLANPGEIYLANADGTGSRLVAIGGEPALSPDGTRVAFSRGGATPGIVVLNLATGEETVVFSEALVRQPVWSPTGQQLAFLRSKQDPVFGIDPATFRPRWTLQDRFSIAILDLGTGAVTDLPSQHFSSSASWSPDGRQIVFDGNTGLYLVNTDGASPPTLIPGTDRRYTTPQWSPDGSLIVFALYRNDHWDIAVIAPRGGGVRLITSSPEFTRASNNVAPVWSPDGQQIAFLSDRDGAWQLYTINLDGTNLRPVFTGDRSLRFQFMDERVVSWSR
ncbi:MAG: hypothetical protein NZ518_02540 [Dehalococcoidia bacterium]|nr:hypothetical protein [Dehalococcoidia bacterium]